MGAKSEPIIIGIDPGVSGGVAFLKVNTNGLKYLAFEQHEKEQLHWRDLPRFQEMLSTYEGKENIIAVVIEDPPSFVGGRPQPASRICKLRESYGFWRAVILSHGWRFVPVLPRNWQVPFPAVSSGPEHKKELCEHAIKLYPALKSFPKGVVKSIADAILIATFFKRHGHY